MLLVRLVRALLITSTTLAAALPAPPDHSHILTVAHQELGVLSIALDTASTNNSLRVLRTTLAGFRPNWLCGAGKYLYSVSRTRYSDEFADEGGIFAFRKDCATGKLKAVGNVRSGGEGACHCDVSPNGQLLSVANIDGSSVSVYPRFRNGTIGDMSHFFPYTLASPGPGHDDSQIQPNPHQTLFSPSGKHMFVPDRGADLIYIYRISKDNHVVRLKDVQVPPGTGPRHGSFWKVSETESILILVGELDNTLRVFSVVEGKRSGELHVSPRQTISTLGGEQDRTHPDGIDLASEVAISPDGRFVYAANRNTSSFDSDFIAIYSFDASNAQGPLRWVARKNTQGKIPRHFSLSNGEGRYLAVLHQVSNDLQIFERDVNTGMLGPRWGRLEFGDQTTDLDVGPIAVVWN